MKASPFGLQGFITMEARMVLRSMNCSFSSSILRHWCIVASVRSCWQRKHLFLLVLKRVFLPKPKLSILADWPTSTLSRWQMRRLRVGFWLELGILFNSNSLFALLVPALFVWYGLSTKRWLHRRWILSQRLLRALWCDRCTALAKSRT